jgi:hypothetical protein
LRKLTRCEPLRELLPVSFTVPIAFRANQLE